jgi:MFS family permease
MGVPAGLALSTTVFAIVRGLTDDATFSAWAWRVPFLLSCVLVIVGLVIRMRLAESPAFRKLEETETKSSKPIVDAVRDHPRSVLTAMGMRMAENGIFYVYTVFMLAYGEDTLKLSEETMLIGIIIIACLGLFTIPFYGRLSDRVGRKPLYMAGAVVSLLMCFPAFLLLDTKSSVLIWLAMILGVNIGHDLMYGPQAAYFAELFGARVRYSGASLGYQFASVFAGGFAPLIAAALLTAGGDRPWLVATYMSVLAVITIVATAFARETYRDDFDEEPQIEPTRRFERTAQRTAEPVR